MSCIMRVRQTLRGKLAKTALAACLIGAHPGIASAGVAFTHHTLPNPSVAGVTALCGPATPGYVCTWAGYSGSEPWGYYTSYGSRDSTGHLHNCTTYAAFRLATNNVA